MSPEDAFVELQSNFNEAAFNIVLTHPLLTWLYAVINQLDDVKLKRIEIVLSSYILGNDTEPVHGLELIKRYYSSIFNDPLSGLILTETNRQTMPLEGLDFVPDTSVNIHTSSRFTPVYSIGLVSQLMGCDGAKKCIDKLAEQGTETIIDITVTGSKVRTTYTFRSLKE